MSREVKQIICMRKDLGMRKGKMVAQGAHASIAFITRQLQQGSEITLSDAAEQWLDGTFTKICAGVDSEQELLEIYEKAKEKGLEVHLVTDSGKTEFDGPTRTCLAIGPNYSDDIDPITSHLKLL